MWVNVMPILTALQILLHDKLGLVVVHGAKFVTWMQNLLVTKLTRILLYR